MSGPNSRRIWGHMSAKRLLIAAAVTVVASACGSSEPDVVELDADIDMLLETSAAAMGSVDTVRFQIDRGGVPVYIDPTGTLEFKDAVGRFVAPQAADAVVKVAISGINVQIGAIAIDGTVWLSNPITGQWEPAPSTYAFDPTSLFSPELGWRPLLGGELREAALVGREEPTAWLAITSPVSLRRNVSRRSPPTSFEIRMSRSTSGSTLKQGMFSRQGLMPRQRPASATGRSCSSTTATDIEIVPPDELSGG